MKCIQKFYSSFQSCYEQTFHIPLPVDEHGVPLEHFVMCVPNISIKQVGPNKTIKIIKRENKKAVNDEGICLKLFCSTFSSNIFINFRDLSQRSSSFYSTEYLLVVSRSCWFATNDGQMPVALGQIHSSLPSSFWQTVSSSSLRPYKIGRFIWVNDPYCSGKTKSSYYLTYHFSTFVKLSKLI